jgi:myo-inositol 2-dehydrogenase/D-chiro-inositol 1-dehydrogenase
MPLRSVEPGMPPPPAEAWANFQQRFEPAYRAELSAFLEVAAGRRKNPCTPEDALEALRVAVACDLSRAEHRPVRLEEVS